jgi:hypothetical protein
MTMEKYKELAATVAWASINKGDLNDLGRVPSNVEMLFCSLPESSGLKRIVHFAKVSARTINASTRHPDGRSAPGP